MQEENTISSEKMCMVYWSFSKNTPLHNVTLAKWQELSRNLDIDFYILTDDKSVQQGNVIHFSRNTWKQEWLEAIDSLQSMSYKRIVSILDDFYLIDHKGLNKNTLIDFCNNDWDYLSLVAHPNSISVIPYKNLSISHGYCNIPVNWRYRNSLQVSCWKLSVMREIIEKSENIWDFEEIRHCSDRFYCVVKDKIKYRHILEKGMLNYNGILFAYKEFKYLRRYYRYNKAQLLRLPRIIISNCIIKFLGFRQSEKDEA